MWTREVLTCSRLRWFEIEWELAHVEVELSNGLESRVFGVTHIEEDLVSFTVDGPIIFSHSSILSSKDIPLSREAIDDSGLIIAHRHFLQYFLIVGQFDNGVIGTDVANSDGVK